MVSELCVAFVQDTMGHADPRTTRETYSPQATKRHREVYNGATPPIDDVLELPVLERTPTRHV